MTRELRGLTHPDPSNSPAMRGSRGAWSRPRALPGTSAAGTSQISTDCQCRWIESKREYLQHERLRLDWRWDFLQRAQNLGTNLYKNRGWEGENEPDRHTSMSPATDRGILGDRRMDTITWPAAGPEHVRFSACHSFLHTIPTL